MRDHGGIERIQEQREQRRPLARKFPPPDKDQRAQQPAQQDKGKPRPEQHAVRPVGAEDVVADRPFQVLVGRSAFD